MRKPEIPNYAINVRDKSWFYVSPTHLEVLKAHPAGYITHAKIPWGKIMRQAAKCGHWNAKQEIWTPRKAEVPDVR